MTQAIQPRIPGLSGALQIVWDKHGFIHVLADTVDDAYAGLGYAAGYERLWQIHLSTLYATGTLAAVLGERFALQDALVRTLDIPGIRPARTVSAGDAIAAAYLRGLNAYVANLDELPPEFLIAGTQPRAFTLDDIAARHRFSGYHQHKPIMEKLVLARLVAAHGATRWQGHVSQFTPDDLVLAQTLTVPYGKLSLALGPMFQPLAKAFGATADDSVSASSLSGSNNWAVRGARSLSGKPLLASDPHQPHSVPNTFMYAHLSATIEGQAWDVMGATFPGVPYFMFGHTRDIAWGLTTGFVDNCDVYIERLNSARTQYQSADGWRGLTQQTLRIERKGATSISVPLQCTQHGPLMEPLLQSFGLTAPRADEFRTALRWASGEASTPGGALTRLPFATSVEEFGETLFDHGVTALVNNIICVDRHDGIARWIAATLPKRHGVSGVLPLPGWDARYDFGVNSPAEMRFDYATSAGFSVTANDDTFREQTGRGQTGRGAMAPFPVQTYSTSNARADRITELLLAREKWDVAGFQSMQRDLVDLDARAHAPALAALLAESTQRDALHVAQLLRDWRDYACDVTSIGATVWQALIDTRWHLHFMSTALRADGMDASVLADVPYAAALNRWHVQEFMAPNSPWLSHSALLLSTLERASTQVIERLRAHFGNHPADWQFGAAQHISFAHSQLKHAPFARMRIDPTPIGGSATTLAMAMHLPHSAAEDHHDQRVAVSAGASADNPAQQAVQQGATPLWRVYHGPAFRFVVDLAQPMQSHWVIAGGNSARVDSSHVTDQFGRWLAGELITVALDRGEVLSTAVRTLAIDGPTE